MNSFQVAMSEYKKQLDKGYIKEAYRGLMKFLMDLRVYLKNKYPDYIVGSVYHGYMDMTYFSFFPESLKSKQLKIAIVFNHDLFRFEVWLAGSNKNIQKRYWDMFIETNWDKYTLPLNIKNKDSIVEYNLVPNPDFSDLEALKEQIELGTIRFIGDIEDFLARN